CTTLGNYYAMDYW
nr:immunoglobulin heavy chain junction region [Mus musculus]